MMMDRRIQAESTGGDDREAGGVAFGAAVEIGVETKEEWKYGVLEVTRRMRLKNGARSCVESHREVNNNKIRAHK